MKRRDDSGIETNFEVRCLDAAIPLAEYERLPKTPLYVILDNLRSAFNVGAIFRLCDAMRVKGLFLCGYTACPPHAKLEKTSLGTVRYVPWKRFPSAADAVRSLKQDGIAVWAAETTSVSRPYHSLDVPPMLGVVFGNEALGVSREVLDMCDGIVEIPVLGFKNSINVATSCAVIGFWAVGAMLQKKITATHGSR